MTKDLALHLSNTGQCIDDLIGQIDFEQDQYGDLPPVIEGYLCNQIPPI